MVGFIRESSTYATSMLTNNDEDRTLSEYNIHRVSDTYDADNHCKLTQIISPQNSA
jgi:lipopolysaccharide biosynthesis glycosyltransferase